MSEPILVRFSWSVGRHADIEEVFETTRERLAEFPGMPVYFGECAGKHSEVYGRLKAEDFTILAASSDEIETVKKVLGALPADVDIEESITRAIESFSDENVDVSDTKAALASVLMPEEPGYEERKAARRAKIDALRCHECRKLGREHGGGTYSHERWCSNPSNREPGFTPRGFIVPAPSIGVVALCWLFAVALSLFIARDERAADEQRAQLVSCVEVAERYAAVAHSCVDTLSDCRNVLEDSACACFVPDPITIAGAAR